MLALLAAAQGRGVHAQPDRRRGVGPDLGRGQPHAGRARGHAAHEARPPRAGADRARASGTGWGCPTRRRASPSPAETRGSSRARPAAGDRAGPGRAAGRGPGRAAGAVGRRRPRQQRLFTDRLTDTISFASLAERPITEGDTTGLQAELPRYDAVFGIAVVVLDRDGQVVADLAARAPGAGRRRGASGCSWRWPGAARSPTRCWRRGTTGRWCWPSRCWSTARCAGRSVTVSPTDGLRAGEVLLVWAGSLAAGLARAGAGGAGARCRSCAGSCARSAASTRAPAGSRRRCWPARTPDPVADGTGPPELRRLSVSFDRMAATVTQAYARAARLRRRRQPPAAQPADGAAAAAVQPGGPRRRPDGVDDHLGGAGGGRAALHAARRPARAGPRRAHRAADAAVDVDPAVDDRVEAWRPLAEHTGLRPGCAAACAGCAPLRRPGAVETVLDAVLDNAVKFSPPGGTITVHDRGRGDRVEVAVRDTGPGHRPRRARPGPPPGSGAARGRATSRAPGSAWRSPRAPLESGGGELRLELPAGGGLRVVALLRPSAPADGAGRGRRVEPSFARPGRSRAAPGCSGTGWVPIAARGSIVSAARAGLGQLGLRVEQRAHQRLGQLVGHVRGHQQHVADQQRGDRLGHAVGARRHRAASCTRGRPRAARSTMLSRSTSRMRHLLRPARRCPGWAARRPRRRRRAARPPARRPSR